jgi:hypothetical protein
MRIMAKPTHKPDDPEQSKRFIALAEEFEVDTETAEFDRAFRKVATAERKSAVPPTPRPKRKKKR